MVSTQQVGYLERLRAIIQKTLFVAHKETSGVQKKGVNMVEKETSQEKLQKDMLLTRDTICDTAM